MKKISSFIIVVVVFLVLCAGTVLGAEKKFFVSGYMEVGLHWPHNEIEMNLRRPDLPETNGFGDNFGRYAIRGEIFAGYHFGGRIIKSIFVVVKPYFVFGRTIPQMEYTWSARPIGYAKHYGVGMDLFSGWKVYVETHRWELRDQLAVTGDGPYGLNSGVYIRKDFNIKF